MLGLFFQMDLWLTSWVSHWAAESESASTMIPFSRVLVTDLIFPVVIPSVRIIFF